MIKKIILGILLSTTISTTNAYYYPHHGHTLFEDPTKHALIINLHMLDIMPDTYGFSTQLNKNRVALNLTVQNFISAYTKGYAYKETVEELYKDAKKAETNISKNQTLSFLHNTQEDYLTKHPLVFKANHLSIILQNMRLNWSQISGFNLKEKYRLEKRFRKTSLTLKELASSYAHNRIPRITLKKAIDYGNYLHNSWSKYKK